MCIRDSFLSLDVGFVIAESLIVEADPARILVYPSRYVLKIESQLTVGASRVEDKEEFVRKVDDVDGVLFHLLFSGVVVEVCRYHHIAIPIHYLLLLEDELVPFASGGWPGGYIATGRALSEAIEDVSGLDKDLLPADGSLDNLLVTAEDFKRAQPIPIILSKLVSNTLN